MHGCPSILIALGELVTLHAPFAASGLVIVYLVRPGIPNISELVLALVPSRFSVLQRRR